MDIKDSYLHGTVGVVKSISVSADKLKYKLADIAGTVKEVTLPIATTSANGLMSSGDKTKLDNLSSTIGNYVTLNTDQEITGTKTFTKQLKFTVADGTAPFTVTSTTKVDNLNTDLLDGKHLTDILNVKTITSYSALFDLNSLGDNNIDSTTWYYAGSPNVLNQPWDNSAATVWTFPGSYAMQIAKFYSRNEFKIRGKISDGWSSWKTIAFTDSDITGNAATATHASTADKLKTKRKLWGLDFDGSADVKGTITIGGGLTNNRSIQFPGGEFFDRYGNFYLDGTNEAANSFNISKTNTDGTDTPLFTLRENKEASFYGTLTAPTFQGNLDGTYVNKLTGYKKATSPADLAATDTLNTALGKLEYKADTAYDWYKSVTGTDNDTIINKWEEIVDFIDSVKEGTDILDEFVTRKTALIITGSKTFTATTNTFSGTGASILTIDRNSTNPAWIRFCKNGTLQGYIGITNDFQPAFLSGESGASYKILIHSGNYTSYVNSTNFPGLNKVGTVTSVTVTGSNGLSGSGTVTTSGTITLSNAGVRSATINGDYLRVNTNGTNADLTIPYATQAKSLKHTTLTSGLDLNTLTTEGVYSHTQTPVCNSLVNGPTGRSNGECRLEVINCGSSSHSLQWLYTKAGKQGEIWYRMGTSNSTWSTWNKIAFISNIPTSLKNPYTLTFSAGTFAAKTYDGSAAVTVNIPTKTSHLTNDSGFVTGGPYLPLAGGTLTGPLKLKSEQYNGNYALDVSNSDIVNVNAIFTRDLAEEANEGLQFSRGDNTYDSVWCKKGIFYFSPNGNTDRKGTYTTNHIVLHSGNTYINSGTITINGNSITPLTTHQSLANYVTLNTALTITGSKLFSVDITLNYLSTNSTSYALKMYGTSDTYKYLYAKGNDLYFDRATFQGKIWRADNDGSGSGLDADLLDGKHASAFLLTEQLANSTDLNTLMDNRLYYSDTDGNSSTMTNAPWTTGFTMLLWLNYNGGDDLRRSRLAINPYGLLRVFNDRNTTGTGGEWYDILTSNNYNTFTDTRYYTKTDSDSRYVNAGGDKMTGTLTFTTTNAISYQGSQATYSMIRFINNTGDAYGNGISIGGGGAVVIGAGESYDALLSDSALGIIGGTETTYISADNGIFFFSNCLSYASKKTMEFNTSGNLVLSGTVNSSGFVKASSSDSYVLLGGGGHKALSSITASSLNSTTIISAKGFSLSNASWTDTGYTFASLASGTYAIQVTCGNLVASGIMSVYKNIDDTAGDEIPLHVYHDSTQPWRPYLRTSGKKLLISSNDGSATSRTVTIKIALIL